jgi:hypothetical protein
MLSDRFGVPWLVNIAGSERAQDFGQLSDTLRTAAEFLGVGSVVELGGQLAGRA